MDVILIPGFWLDGTSWAPVLPALECAGHRAYPVTLPGMTADAADRASISLRDHVDAVVDLVDSLGPAARVVLVGHSGGGAVAHAVVDRRPDRVARVVYVDSAPLAAGHCINDELPVVDGVVPLPDWSVFEEPDLTDLDEGLRAAFRARAIPTPARVATDRQELGDPRRYEVPVTVICCEFSPDELTGWMDADVPFARELARIPDRELVALPTGHWPQLTKPTELAQVLVAAIDRAGAT